MELHRDTHSCSVRCSGRRGHVAWQEVTKNRKNEIEHMEISIGIMRKNLPKILSNMK